MSDISSALKAGKLKVTPQRLAIFGYLLETKAHPSAETIYKHLKTDYPSMSLATVYKTVASLRDAGLICELNTGNDVCRYDANTAFHPHLICTKCNNVYDYPWENMLNDITEKIQNETDFNIESKQVYFYGTCKNCKKQTL